MNYLSSILASIDGPTSESTPPVARPPALSRATLPARPNPARSKGGDQVVQPLKRKAEGEISNTVPAKIARPLTPTQNEGGPRSAIASASGTSAYRGTARPEMAGKATTKPLQKTQIMPTPIKPLLKAEPKLIPLVKTPAAPVPAAKVPKKGSYAEIMARGKQNIATVTALGVIKHKQTEKVSKKERDRLAQEAVEKAKTSAARDKKLGNGKRSGSSEPTARKPGEQVKEKRKAVDLGYTGTARPKAKSAEPQQYRGTMGLSRPGQVRKPAPALQQRAGLKSGRYPEYSDDELDDDEEEEEYGSDLSDMEAGIDDVEEEEELALRAAKLDDAREKALENKLKREKQERKNKLTALAAEARKKKPMY